jgi:ATP-binding cassette, subfamily B, multidrug efflux pump
MENNQPKPSDFVLLKRVLSIAQPFKNLFWWSIILSILLTPFSIAQPFIVQMIVDKHIVPGIREGILALSLLYVLVLVINVVMKYFFIYITAKLGQNVIKDLRTKVFRHVIRLKSRYFDTTPIGTSTTRTINDIEAINNVFAQGVITITADVITIFAVTGIMLYTSWRLTLIVFYYHAIHDIGYLDF